MTSATDVVCLPVKLDAYMLNQSACGPFPNATLTPLAQPNFTWLRVDSSLMESDVLPYHDIHNASPASKNPRMTDLSTGKPRIERQGIYLHWMLPRIYRTGPTQDTQDPGGVKAPIFNNTPDRWLVVRRLHPGYQPADVVSSGKMRWVEAWVVESNRVRNINEFGDDIDIELECAPYVVGDASASIDKQAEIFIGKKTNILTKNQEYPDGWHEERPSNPSEFVPLNVMGASNPLFADYTAHNSNVFSILDNFQYQDGNKTAYLTNATADYYVLGWHSLAAEDNLNSRGGTSLATVFRKSLLSLMKPDGVNMDQSVRALCHGAMYNVQYVADGTNGIKVPANDAAAKLASDSSHPATVGTTPVDAIIAYVRAHYGTLTGAEADIYHLDTLLLKQDDDIDSQQEALDMLTAHNFKIAKDNGTQWHFVAAPGNNANPSTGSSINPAIANPPESSGGDSRTQKVFQPTADQENSLQALNRAQNALDSATRELKAAKQALFAHWWKCFKDLTWSRKKDVKSKPLGTDALVANIQALNTRIGALTALVANAVAALTIPGNSTGSKTAGPTDGGTRLVQQGSQPSFYLQNDPTILIPGVQNPWPTDWLDPDGLKVRMASQLTASLPTSLPEGWDNLPDLVSTQIPNRLPAAIQSAASTLVKEFFDLSQQSSLASSTALIKAGQLDVGLVPVYHDGRDQWSSTQPYFPLFLEYEIEYYHLDYDLWKFEIPDVDEGEPTSIVAGSAVRYGIDGSKDISGMMNDGRIINGRILILPQPGFMISKNIERLFLATNNMDLPECYRDPKVQKALVDSAAKLAYLSAPMTGFMDHLITILNGTHVKPTVRVAPDQPLQALQGAIDAAKAENSGFDGTNIPLMDIETTRTAYANYVDFTDPTVDPLKPVTHGQFKFTKLSVFDKFGQVISALDPAPTPTPPALHPALSEYFHPQHLANDRTKAKTVEGGEDYDSCEYAQFPPTINQEARLNACFVHFDDNDGVKVYRPCTDWETPIWGFLVVNYAEYALQIFLPDGSFYREVRRGGPQGTALSPKWKPFEPPQGNNGQQAQQFPQLDALITQLRDENYLTGFFDMVDEALKSVPHTPSEYAQFLNAIVGRPLALANVGFSLELAAPPVRAQVTSTEYVQPEEYQPPKSAKLLGYPFTVKVGDKDRVYDGLVGYFEANPGAVTGGCKAGQELKLSTMLTYYPSAGNSATTPIDNIVTTAGGQLNLDSDHYPIVHPYHISAQDYSITDPTNLTQNTAQALNMAKAHWSQMTMLGVLMDPFSSLHFYSGLLPVASVQIPAWTLQAAMQRMTAFFHVGPLIVPSTTALQQFDKTKKLPANYDPATMPIIAVTDLNAPTGSDAAKPQLVGIPMPSIKTAEWNWLAPFVVPTDDPPKPTPEGSKKTTKNQTEGANVSKDTEYNAYVISTLDNMPRYEKGPYMALEGFLQLKHPITSPDTT